MLKIERMTIMNLMKQGTSLVAKIMQSIFLRFSILIYNKPAITFMINCQGFSVAPWKMIAWFPRFVHAIEEIENSLQS